MKKTVTVLMALLLCLALTACRESERVAYNISKEADNFNVTRRLTVINARTDTILMQLTGTFALKNNSTSELEVVCELADGSYQKHFVYINEYTLYVVEDISNTDVSKYHYELNFLPQMIPVTTITMSD